MPKRSKSGWSDSLKPSSVSQKRFCARGPVSRIPTVLTAVSSSSAQRVSVRRS
ncbi:hypothetical protein EVA_12413 [gut metagenome]|uniref:Uncharacterized protein n=1 Tax=gut metagenome TaxID=749906 RepID=J9CHC5_9ZZZZ